MFEVEQKYRVDDVADLQSRLEQLGASIGDLEEHSDTYYNHPNRDFAVTGEAFRIRRVNGIPLITYKGAKIAGAIKARREMEWRLDPGDPDGNRTEDLLQVLGFRRVACVQKDRQNYQLHGKFAAATVVIDGVQPIGIFAELERIVDQKSEIESARNQIDQLSAELRLRKPEPLSYLEMVLEFDSGQK